MALGGDTVVEINKTYGLVVGHDVQDEAVRPRDGQGLAVPDEEPRSKVATHVGSNLTDIIRGVSWEKRLPHIIIGGASDIRPVRVGIAALHVDGAHPQFLEEDNIKGGTLQQTLHPSGAAVSMHRSNAYGVFRH